MALFYLFVNLLLSSSLEDSCALVPASILDLFPHHTSRGLHNVPLYTGERVTVRRGNDTLVL